MILIDRGRGRGVSGSERQPQRFPEGRNGEGRKAKGEGQEQIEVFPTTDD